MYIKNPEIVFVADLSRADAPALVVTTQCELQMNSNATGQLMTAAVKDLKVVACPFVHDQDTTTNLTTVLQPCQVFFKRSQSLTQPQTIDLTINSLTLKVRTVISGLPSTMDSACAYLVYGLHVVGGFFWLTNMSN